MIEHLGTNWDSRKKRKLTRSNLQNQQEKPTKLTTNSTNSSPLQLDMWWMLLTDIAFLLRELYIYVYIRASKSVEQVLLGRGMRKTHWTQRGLRYSGAFVSSCRLREAYEKQHGSSRRFSDTDAQRLSYSMCHQAIGYTLDETTHGENLMNSFQAGQRIWSCQTVKRKAIPRKIEVRQ